MNHQVINLIHALLSDLDAYNVPSQQPFKIHIATFNSNTNTFQYLYQDLQRRQLNDLMIDYYHIERNHHQMLIHLDPKRIFLCEMIGSAMYVSLVNQAYIDHNKR